MNSTSVNPQIAFERARAKIRSAISQTRDGQKVSIMDLSASGLEMLPPEIGELSGLEELKVNDNRLTMLPPEIGNLTALTGLCVRNNELTELPPEIGKLTSLEWLSAGNNRLTTLPSEIGRLTALSKVWFYLNQLTELPREIGAWTALTRFHMQDNRLTTLPPEIGLLKNLVLFFLENSRLSALPSELLSPVDSAPLPLLQELDVRKSELTSIPSWAAALPSLYILRVWGNPLPADVLKLSGGRYGQGVRLLRTLRTRT